MVVCDSVTSALSYTDRGWHVIPCQDKRPLGLNGFRGASTDPETIARWYDKWPSAGVGIATEPSRLLVLDIDVGPGGEGVDEAIAALSTEFADLPATLQVTTPSGGRHLYFSVPADGVVGSPVRWRDNVDIRSGGAFVVAPPTPGYAFVDPSVDVAEAPESLIRAIQQHKSVPTVAVTEPAAKLGAGQRNEQLTSVAGSLRRKGVAPADIDATLQTLNGRWCAPPLPPEEVSGIARSIGRYEPEESIRPLERVTEGSLFTPLSELEAPPADYLWEPYLARGCITLMHAPPKLGKTTLYSHVCNQMGSGGHLVGPISAASVLVVSEESASVWVARRERLFAGCDHIAVSCSDFLTPPTAPEWDRFIQRVAAEAVDQGCELVVFDTWGGLNPCDDECDAAKSRAALLPLRRLTNAGLAVLLIHHTRKGQGSNTSDAARGSTAITGFVDILLQLKDGGHTRQRVLTGKSRLADLADAVVELVDDGTYRHLGASSEAAVGDDWQQLQAGLPTDGDWRSRAEITGAAGLDGWPDKRVNRALDHAFQSGHVEREGGQGRGGYRYRRMNAESN